jgi:hypothetical protein
MTSPPLIRGGGCGGNLRFSFSKSICCSVSGSVHGDGFPRPRDLDRNRGRARLSVEHSWHERINCKMPTQTCVLRAVKPLAIMGPRWALANLGLGPLLARASERE